MRGGKPEMLSRAERPQRGLRMTGSAFAVLYVLLPPSFSCVITRGRVREGEGHRIVAGRRSADDGKRWSRGPFHVRRFFPSFYRILGGVQGGKGAALGSDAGPADLCWRFFGSQNAPRRAKTHPRRAKTHPRRPKMRPEASKTAQRRPKRPPRRAKTRPRRPKIRSKSENKIV